MVRAIKLNLQAFVLVSLLTTTSVIASASWQDFKDLGEELWFSNVVLRNHSDYPVCFNVSKSSNFRDGLNVVLQPEQNLFIYFREIKKSGYYEFNEEDMIDVNYRVEGRQFISEADVSTTLTYLGSEGIPSDIVSITSSSPKMIRFSDYVPVSSKDVYNFIIPFKIEYNIYITIVESETTLRSGK